MSPEISVIIPACNEEAYLSATLESLERQTLQSFEVIVIANGCTDRTADVARSFSTVVAELEESNTSAARNKGASLARTDRFVFLDADTPLSRNALEEILLSLTNHEGTFIGTCRIEPECSHLRAKVLTGVKNALHQIGIPWGGSGVIFCQRNLFDKVQFDEDMRFREDGNFVRSALRHGKYHCLTCCYAIPSLRKMEYQGYVRYAIRWVGDWLRSELGIESTSRSQPRA